MDGQTATGHFATLVSTLRFADLGVEAVASAKASILDAIGCMLAGAGSVEATTVRRALTDDGIGATPVVGTRTLLSRSGAALANGTAGHADDYDDSLPMMIGHPSVPIIATAISLASPGPVAGADLITAHVAGLEVGAGLGRHMNPDHYKAGWHATATLGALAATASGARLLGLDPKSIARAIGAAVASASGIRKNIGTMAKPLHAGLAARNGVLSVQLARAGLVTDETALDGANGFIRVFGGGGDAPLSRNGGELEINASGIGIKLYPCCGCTHAALDAMLALMSEHRFDAADVVSVHCTMNALAAEILVHHRPADASQAKFSLEYCLAVALLDGTCGLEQFRPDRVASVDVVELMQRIQLSVDSSTTYRNGVYPATVTVALKDRVVSTSREQAMGHPERPISPLQLEQKFIECASRVLPAGQVERALQMLSTLEGLPELEPLIESLVPPDRQS